MDRIAYATFAKLEDSHFWFVSRRRIFFDLLDRELRGESALRVLEVGCGAGGMLGPLQRYGTVHGLDIDRDYVQYCAQRGFQRVLCGSGYELPFPDASFDLVCLFDTIEHIPEEQLAMAEIARVLKPGGRVFFSVPAYQWLWSQNDKIAHHCRRYTAGRLRLALQSAGLAVRRMSYFNAFLLPLIVPAILLQKLRERFGKLPDGYNNTSVQMPSLLNRMFTAVMSSERWFLRWLSFPVGHSLLCIAKKP
ncbi:methyltransferase [Planctomycetota bacterium]|nr:class I SAM-dependent methyltransferase [Planctomycetota bacterium]GDY02830.1 methyltransferase [Planctomycetota bacterium]